MRPYIYVILTTFLFSTMEVSFKVVALQVNPLTLVFFRFFVAGLVLLPLALRTLKTKLTTRDYLFFAGMGLLCVVISMIAFQIALELIPASAAAVLVCCNPAFTVVFARILLGERIYPTTVLTIVLCIAGILFIINPFDVDMSPLGAMLVVFSAAVFSIYSIISRKHTDRYPLVAICCFGFLLGSAEMLLLIGFGHIPLIAEFFTGIGLNQFANVSLVAGITLQNLPVLLYVGVCVTGIGYMLYFLAMMEKSATFASIPFLIKPVLATLFSMWLLRETIQLNMILGIICILTGSAILLWKNTQLEKAHKTPMNYPYE